MHISKFYILTFEIKNAWGLIRSDFGHIKKKQKFLYPTTFRERPAPLQFDVGGFCENSHVSVTERDRKSCLVPKFAE